VDRPLRLLELDPDLGRAIADPRRRRAASHAVTVTGLDLATGQKLDLATLDQTAPLGLLLVDGFVLRELVTAGRACAELLGPEDVVHTSHVESGASVLPVVASWVAISDAQLALLDDGFFTRAAEWPEIAAAIVERAGRPGQRLTFSRAIGTLPTVDARLLASLWGWASEWATVGRDGVVLRVPLSHERIARLIGARRPTITSAVGRLRKAGLLEQRPDGAWLLRSPADRPANSAAALSMPVLEGMLDPPGLGVGRTAAVIGRGSRRSEIADGPAANDLARRKAV
jgi:CRP-like cAMP-binding protein